MAGGLSAVMAPRKASHGAHLGLHLRQLIACRWISVPGTEGTWSGRKNARAQGDQGGARSYGVRGGRAGVSVGRGGVSQRLTPGLEAVGWVFGDARSGGPRAVVERCVSLATRHRLGDSAKVWVKSDEAEWGIGSAERRGALAGAVQEQRSLVAGGS